MKNKLTLLLLAFAFVQLAVGQNNLLNVHGHVYDIETGGPISYQVVTLEIESAGMIIAYDFETNSNGYYGDSIPVFSQGNVVISTVDCMGMMHTFEDTFGPSNFTIYHDFAICTDTSSMACVAGFEPFYPPMGGTTVFFSNYSTGDPTDWLWDFGDGTTSTEWEPEHTYNAYGIYPVCLTIWSNDSVCFSAFCQDVEVGTNSSDCENYFWYETWNLVDFVFTGESLPTPADYYSWDFGDGNTGSGQTVSHTYNLDTASVVVVTLTTYVYDPATGDTCVAESGQDVFVGGLLPDCENWFDYVSTDAFTFEFYGDGLPPATDYFWDFGDGNTGYGQTVVHTYNTAGAMNVTLTTLHTIPGSADSCLATSFQQVMVGDSSLGCENFFYYEQTPSGSILFSGMGYPEVDLYLWDFGDGTTGVGQEIEHTFDPSLGDVFVVQLSTHHLTPSGDTCLAVSSQEVWTGNTGWDCENWFWFESWDYETFDFYGEAYPYPADYYYWDFGDGTTATGQQASHTYNASPGEIFVVSLVTFGLDPATGDSCIAESVQEIVIGGTVEDCENFFWYESGEDFSFEFFGEAIPYPADYYLWDFGDGTTAEGQSVSHIFNPELGTEFLVCLQTWGSGPMGDSCVAESCQMITLGGQSGVEVYGTVYADNEAVDAALVGLFGADPDDFYYEFTLTEPGTGSYFFENVPEGDYYLFTSLTPQSTEFYNYFPTYYGDAIFWFDAELLSFGIPDNPYNVHLEPMEPASSGPGVIEGTVTMEDGKSGPGENIGVVLMTEQHAPIDFAQTNENGVFEFGTLAFGTYALKVEMPGVNSEIALVDLSEEHQHSELQFFIHNNSAYLGLENKLRLVSSVGRVFPNPVSTEARLEIESDTPTTIILRLIDPTGRLLMQRNEALGTGQNILTVKTSDLVPGMYYIQLIDEYGNSMSRKFSK